jgi:recombination protein RecA
MAKEKAKGKSVHVTTDATADTDGILSSIADEFNKKNKDGSAQAISFDQDEDLSLIPDWVSTGSSILDLAISNRANAGLPVGRFVELTGLEGTGKSLMAAHIVANTQKKGGVALMIDTENSAAPEFWRSVGVDISKNKLQYVQAETVEDIFNTIEFFVAKVRQQSKDILFTIIVDSVAAASTKAELESEHGKTGYATDKSIIISKAMRKITTMMGKQKVLIVFTNQLRQNLKAMAFSDPWVVSGGKALAYHCSVRVRLNTTGKLKKGEDVIGVNCKAEVKKTRFGPGNRNAKFAIYYDSGIADYAGWLDVLKTKGIFKQSGAYYSYTRANGEEMKFQSKDYISMMQTDTTFRDEVYKAVCDEWIMLYKEANSVVIDDAVVDEGEDTDAGSNDENG